MAATSKVKITVWGINYYPEQIGIGLYSTEMCEFLAEAGFDIDVVTGYPYYPYWKPLSKITHIYQQDRRNGVVIQRCWHYVPEQPGALKRILHELSFVVMSFLRLLFMPRADVYLVISPPLLLGPFAFLLSILKRSKYAFHIQDLQPDAALALGMLKPGPFVSFIRFGEWLAYTGACVVSSISEEICELIAQRCAPGKVVLFPNWIPDLSKVPEGPSWKSQNKLDADTKVIAYSGNLGRKQGLNLIVELADRLREQKNIVFLIGGAGPTLDPLKEECERLHLTNIIFQGLLEEDEHTRMLQDVDIFLIPQQAGSGQFLFPSKLLKVLALGCTVLSNSEESSALTRVLKDNDCGIVIPNGNAELLAEQIVTLLPDQARRAILSTNSRKYVERLRKQYVLSSFAEHLAKLSPTRTIKETTPVRSEDCSRSN